MSNFHPLEVVDRGSDPQLQEGENLNKKGRAYRMQSTFFRDSSISHCINEPVSWI